MEFSTGDAKNRLTELIRAVEAGEEVVITRHGKPVVELVPPRAKRREVVFDGMKDIIKFHPGWDGPIDEDRFLEGDI